MNSPLVSVVVLSYNRRDCTLKCLESVRTQTYRPVEVVVLDNGSKDGSADAIRERFPETLLIRMPCNYGDWEGRDIAAANCRGGYLFSLDNDATMEPDTVEKLVARMEQEPELAVAQGRVVDPNTGQVEGVGPNAECQDRDRYRATFLGGAALIRMSALRAAGGFPHYLLGGGEPFLSYRFLDMDYRVLYHHRTTIYHTKSSLERIPHQRYFLTTLQRLRALMAHYPGVARPLLELCVIPLNGRVGAARNGYGWYLPLDLIRLWAGGAAPWRGPWRIKRRTVRLVDYLRSHVVTSPEEYAAIPVDRSQFLHFVHFRVGGKRSVSAHRSSEAS